MTKDEYIEVCSKYSEYLCLTDNGVCYIKGAIKLSENQVTAVEYDSIDDNKIKGKVWTECYITNIGNIHTTWNSSRASNKEDFEFYIQKFIENYKKCVIELKKKNIEKDFLKYEY